MQRLREAREAAGLSLAKVGAKLGLSHVFLYKVELGESPLPMKHWSKLAESLGRGEIFVAQACVDAGAVKVDASSLGDAERRQLAALLASFAERCSS